jgi:hypothetical protein
MMRPAKPPALRLPPTQRSYRRPIVVSAAVHAALVVAALWVIEVSAAHAPRMPGSPGPPVGGGGRVRYMKLPAYRPARAGDPTSPVSRRLPEQPRVEMQDVAPPPTLADAAHAAAIPVAVADPRLLASGAGPGGGGGGGRGGGSGAASGSGGAGAGDDIFPPQARYSILPPLPRPASVRGRTFRVHFWVDAAGNVTRVAVSPPIPNAGYARQFTALMSQYTFSPARRPDGTATSGETVLTFTL